MPLIHRSHDSWRPPRFLVIVFAAAVALGVAGAATPALATSGPQARVEISPLAALVPAGAVSTGTATGTAAIRVYLSGRDESALRTLVDNVSNPASPQYRHYLTPAQYAVSFGATSAQESAVSAWLRSCGMSVTSVNQHYVAASGSDAAAGCTVGTPMSDYHWNGTSLRAPAASPTVPQDVAGDVLSITGLSSVTPTVTPASVPAVSPATAPSAATAQAAAASSSSTCSQYFGESPASTLPDAYGVVQPWHVCGYTPAQLRSAYGVASGSLTGAGATIAIVDAYASPTMASDAQQYVTDNGGQAWASGQYTEVVPSGLPAQPLAWTEEEAMDVEAAHAIAPAANVVYVAAAGTDDSDFIAALSQIVDGHLANIVNCSWVLGADTGIPSATVAAFDQVFMQGAAEGIGFVAASGDTGSQALSDDGNGAAVTAAGYPASDPMVTAVGGTTLAIGASGNALWQTGWETDYAPLSSDGTSWSGLPGTFADGSGGGPSGLFARPSYQQNLVPAKFGDHRVVPDVAMDADVVTGMLVGQTFDLPTGNAYVQYASGGSSLAAPLFAGIQALAQQHAGHPLGFANPAIYAAAAAGEFTDITKSPDGYTPPAAAVESVLSVSSTGAVTSVPMLATFGEDKDAGLAVTEGYDDVTGVGSPTLAYVTGGKQR